MILTKKNTFCMSGGKRDGGGAFAMQFDNKRHGNLR